MSADVLSGAAQGAAAGSVAGPVGAVVGAVFGAIGGIFKKKSKKKKRQAEAELVRMAEREAAMQRRDMLRQYRILRAQSVAAAAAEAGGLVSSPAQGAISSLESQTSFNLRMFDTQIASNRRVNQLMGKAEKYAGYASTVSSLLSAGADLYTGLGGKPVSFRTFRPAPTTGIVTPSAGFNYGLAAPGTTGRF